MRDVIIYNRNNPCILFYEGGNKGIGDRHMADMLALRDRWDPDGGRAMGAREMLGSDAAMYGDEMLHINKSAGKPLWAHEYSRDEAARAYQDEWTPPFRKDAPDYNRNVDPMAVEDVRRWWDYYAQRPGGGDRASAGGVKIGFTDSNSHFRGDDNYRRSGVLDAVRLPKDAWHVHRAMWDGWVEVEGRYVHLIGHWTYAADTARAEDNHILATRLPVELGVNRVLIRSTENAGRVRLTASAAGLKPATIAVASRAAPVRDGLSTTFAEDFQPADLSRGPTPPDPSFAPRLRSVPVAAIAAGSNAVEAGASRDDDESTTWSSDGAPANAWIEYRFARPERVSALSLRLTGWRIRSYPIRVTLDGRVVFERTTPKSLGDVDLPVAPATGRTLRIAMTDPTADRDAFGNIVEVKNDRVAASVGADKVPAGWRLSLVEADILGPVER